MIGLVQSGSMMRLKVLVKSSPPSNAIHCSKLRTLANNSVELRVEWMLGQNNGVSSVSGLSFCIRWEAHIQAFRQVFLEQSILAGLDQPSDVGQVIDTSVGI